jgi:16S rRNA (cytosine967-C5)-methyltransferase
MSTPIFKRTGTLPPPHPLLGRAVAVALQAIFMEGRYADKVIEQALRQNNKAGSRDRAFIAESTYDVVRHWRRYCAILGRKPAVEADFWQILGIHMAVTPAFEGTDWPEWRELAGLSKTVIIEKNKALSEQRAIRESIPDWLDELGQRELADRWDTTLQALNQPAAVVLRTNTLKTDREKLQKTLAEEGIATQPVGTDVALRLEQRQNVFQTKAFQQGLFELQDYSSQQVAALLAPQPGMRVVDACAGGGGKTLHLAALLQNKGSLIALDTFAWKLDELRARARRAGATNIETRTIENRKVIKRLYGSADRLLLDVPCSGLGVLRRNPDSKWKLTPELMDNLHTTQRDILASYSPITKPGGLMVYATCSIMPAENEQQVQHFLQSEAGAAFQLLSERHILPQDEGFDGFYMALIARKQSV